MELGVTDPVPSLDIPAITHQLQQGFWGGAQAGVAPIGAQAGVAPIGAQVDESVVGGLKRLAVTAACGNHLNDPGGTDPGFTDVLRCLSSGPQLPGDVTVVTFLLTCCHKRDVPLLLKLAADLTVQDVLIGFHGQEGGSRHPAPGAVEKRLLGVQRIRLQQHTLQIELAHELLKYRPLVVLAGGVTGLTDRKAQGS